MTSPDLLLVSPRVPMLRARPNLPQPLVQTVLRDAEILGDLLDGVAPIKHLPHRFLTKLR